MNPAHELNEAIARKVLVTVDAGLVNGMGVPEPGKMCVEAAVCYAYGLPHSDEPPCVAPAVRRLKIRLNDARWSNDAARTKGLRRLAIAQLGSAGVLDEREFAKRCATLAIQTCVPNALRAAASMQKQGSAHKERLLAAADLCERAPTRQHALEARAAAAYASADAYAAYAATATATAAADATAADATAASAAAYAADAAADAAAAAYAAAYAYAYAAYADDADAYADAAARDKALAAYCEGVVQILIDMKAPGCAYLWLTEQVSA
jgi:hypothetical protein